LKREVSANNDDASLWSEQNIFNVNVATILPSTISLQGSMFLYVYMSVCKINWLKNSWRISMKLGTLVAYCSSLDAISTPWYLEGVPKWAKSVVFDRKFDIG